jgi:hypothetical protein
MVAVSTVTRVIVLGRMFGVHLMLGVVDLGHAAEFIPPRGIWPVPTPSDSIRLMPRPVVSLSVEATR